MSASTKTLSFVDRQEGIIPLVRVRLVLTGTQYLPVEYISGSEIQNTDGSWSYTFLIQEEDLPGAIDMTDVRNANIISPYWLPLTEEVAENECPARAIVCFDNINLADGIGDGDLLIVKFNEDCDTYCLERIDPASILPEDPEVAMQSLDYEALSPTEDITGIGTIYVTHMPRQFAVDSVRISTAQIGGGSMQVQIKINGTDLLDAPLSFNTGARTFLIPSSGFKPAWEGVDIPAGAVIELRVTGVSWTMYATNWRGVRIAFNGRATA